MGARMTGFIWLFSTLFYPVVGLFIGMLLGRRGWSLPSTLAVSMGGYLTMVAVLYALIGF